MSSVGPLRLFTDSNVLIGGIVSGWGLDKAILSICAAQVCKMVLAQVVKDEVEEALLIRVGGVEKGIGDRILQQYDRLLQLTRPYDVPYPSSGDIAASRHLIRHAADVPVLLSAIASRPDWLLTNNVEHFTEEVSKSTGLRIATPRQFFVALARR